MIKLFFKSYASLLFSSSVYFGVAFFAISFLNFSVAIFGIIALMTSMLFIYIFQVKKEIAFQPFYLYNSLLIGMGVGYLLVPTLFSLTLTIILSAFTLLLSLLLSSMMSRYGMSILSLPFAIVSLMTYYFLFNHTNVLLTSFNTFIVFDIDLPLSISTLFKALGSIFFLPNTLAGIMILIALFVYSRIMFLVAVISFYFGVAIDALFFSSWQEALSYAYSFNYIITALALFGIFLLPNVKSLLLTLLAVIMTVVLAHFMTAYYGNYTLTLPFNIVVNSLLLVLYLRKYKSFNMTPLSTPEASITNHYLYMKRFAFQEIQISLPFSGTWSVYQAFDGQWTHQGKWRHAYDFVMTKEDKTYRNRGDYLEDYYCYGEAILSPVRGYVIACKDTLKDNLIGEIDKTNNWGNYIIIQTLYGHFVEISHLMQGSLRVKEGDYLTLNTPLAKCGNSGYSAQPHIHIQVQKSAMLGTETLAFCFSEFQQENNLLFYALPRLNELVTKFIAHQYVAKKFTFTPNESYTYDVFENNTFLETYTLKVASNEVKELYFEDSEENKLFFYQSESLFYFYKYLGTDSYLKKIFLLVPKVPLTNTSLSFQDYLPKDLTDENHYKNVTQLCLSFNLTQYIKPYHYRLENNTLKSTFGEVYLASQGRGFSKLIYDNLELRIKTQHEI